MEDKLADSVPKLSVFLCTEEFADSQACSTFLVYFSGILGFSPGGTTFVRARNYTPKLLALIHCIRLCLLEAILPRFAHKSIGWESRPRAGNLKRLNKVRERFMCHGCQALMGEFISLRKYGRAISHSDGPSFRVRWSDDGETVSWDDGPALEGRQVDKSLENANTGSMRGGFRRVGVPPNFDRGDQKTC